jgi:glutathione S-transferase
MRNTTHAAIRLYQFPRMFDIPNLSPFCCKLETWLRITQIPYTVVETNPRKGPKGKLPFIEDAGALIGDSSLIVDHLKRTRGVDPDARLADSQRPIALLVQRALEEHYAFIILYTHFIRPDGWRHTRATFDFAPAYIRPLVSRLVRGNMRKLLWTQGVSRHSDEDIIEAALQDWSAVLALMSSGPYFFGDEPSGLDAVLFGALATTVLTPIESPIKDFLRSDSAVVAYAERMRTRFFPDLVGQHSLKRGVTKGRAGARAGERVARNSRLSHSAGDSQSSGDVM